MNGQVVHILTGNQLKQLGVVALGDILMLRKFCDGEPATQPEAKTLYDGESLTHQDKRKKNIPECSS